MRYTMYSIKDSLSGYMTPVLEANDPVAVRNFAMACDAVKRDQSVMAYRPSDFGLYKIGEFDTELGVLSPLVPPELLCTGDSLQRSERDAQV